jgi:hypothetical protein
VICMLHISQPIQWNVPFYQYQLFVERKEIQKDLKSFFSEKISINPRKNTIVLTGLIGCGKTELALHYFKQLTPVYTAKIWFNAHSTDQLNQDYRDFCLRFDIHIGRNITVIEAVKKWLRQNSDWLVIYDGATNSEILAPYLPEGNGHILITSRTRYSWGHYNILHLDVINESEAIELLERRICKENLVFTPTEIVSIKALAKELGYLPLALAQAGEYIKDSEGHISLEEYLYCYQYPSNRLNMLSNEYLFLRSHSYLTSTKEVFFYCT